MTSVFDNHQQFNEPLLAFHPDRPSDTHVHPLKGLLEYGPRSKGFTPEPIRVASIAPAVDAERLYGFLKELRSPATAKERLEYLPDWPGFEIVFRARMSAAAPGCHIKLDDAFEAHIQQAVNPHVAISERLVREIRNLYACRAEFDVLFIYMPDRWAAGFKGGEDEDFDLHDYLKAVTAQFRIPVQIVQESGALNYHCRASVLWRIGVALYAKAGGVPWTLAQSESDVAYIGISYALKGGAHRSGRFVTCCSQVFDAEGSGLEFVAYEAREAEVHGDNPFLSRAEMFRVMTRSLDLYRRRHAGRSPRSVVVHKTTEFKRDEVDGCMEALHLCEAVDLVQVVEDVTWRGVLISRPGRGAKKGQPAAFPVPRGTLLGIGPRESLMWTHGDVSNVAHEGRSYFQGKRGTPRPIRLVRHAGHGPWDATAEAILGLTKMNWNNDSLYDFLPATLGYAKVLARIVKRMPKLERVPYQFRFFM
ncbi:MAG: hypothetical protein AAGA95_16590 [Pseudomonadota bacterium]